VFFPAFFSLLLSPFLFSLPLFLNSTLENFFILHLSYHKVLPSYLSPDLYLKIFNHGFGTLGKNHNLKKESIRVILYRVKTPFVM
jgi:hypothetical protein